MDSRNDAMPMRIDLMRDTIKDAIAAFDRAMERHPVYSEPWFDLASAMYGLGLVVEELDNATPPAVILRTEALTAAESTRDRAAGM